MTEIGEQPRQIEIPEVNNFFSGTLPEGVGPKTIYLEPWFRLFDKLELPQDKVEEARAEFTIAHILNQAFIGSNQFDSDRIKGLNFNVEGLKYSGIDPARILRYLILQTSYPKGISLDNNNFTFSLEPKDLKNLLNATKIIPGYENFSKDDLIEKILFSSLGFMDNKTGGNYVLQLNQKGFKEFVNRIAHTQSSSYR